MHVTALSKNECVRQLSMFLHVPLFLMLNDKNFGIFGISSIYNKLYCSSPVRICYSRPISKQVMMFLLIEYFLWQSNNFGSGQSPGVNRTRLYQTRISAALDRDAYLLEQLLVQIGGSECQSTKYGSDIALTHGHLAHSQLERYIFGYLFSCL